MNREPIVQRAKKVDLDTITARKKEILGDIRIQKDVIIQAAQNIVAPFTALTGGGHAVADGASGIMKKFNTGLVIFDGLMLGFKIIKKVKGFFHRRR